MATPQIGDEFAGYRVEALIGRGGMGVVYRAEQQRPHRRVALKLLAPELTADQNFRDRFIRESDLAAAIEHPNIIPIYDAGEEDGQLYIAMRYVEGSDLKGLIAKEGRLDPNRALSLAAQVGGALDVAHERGLVHRDVKPHNMLIASGAGPESTDHVYLTDFGLTKHTASRSGLTAAGHFVGTIDYVAPEQIEGKSIDPRTDIYSLGCVLFEILTGRMPYERDTEVSVMYAHISDAPPTVTGLRQDLPPGIDAVIAKALAKKPGDRFSSCRELVAAAREELGIVSGEKRQAVTPGGGTVIAAGAGAAGAAAGAAMGGSNVPTGDTVADAPAPAAQGSAPAGGGGEWQAAPAAQQGGGWQGQQTPPPGGPSGPGWQQGPPPSGPSDPTWQPPPGGGGTGGGGWQGGPGGSPPGGPSGPGWDQGPPSKGPNKGLLFGIIGALVLIAAGVGAFLFLSGDDEPTPASSPSPVASASAIPSDAPSASASVEVSPGVSPTIDTGFPAAGEEAFLFQHIPVPVQPTCESQDPALMPAGATVGITCQTNSGADFVSYYKYPTLPTMNNQYEIGISIAGATRGIGTCPTDIPSESEYTQRSSKVVGRVLCYEFEGAGRIEWTNNKLLVYSEAVSLGGMSPTLHNFWANEAGPLSQPGG